MPLTKTAQASTVLSPDLLQAYRETEYRVQTAPELVLRVDETNAGLLALHKRHHVDCSAFITACNPYSAALDDAANAARQADLAKELKLRSLTFLPGVGQHPNNHWPGEPSFLVLGLMLEGATAGYRVGPRCPCYVTINSPKAVSIPCLKTIKRLYSVLQKTGA